MTIEVLFYLAAPNTFWGELTMKDYYKRTVFSAGKKIFILIGMPGYNGNEVGYKRRLSRNYSFGLREIKSACTSCVLETFLTPNGSRVATLCHVRKQKFNRIISVASNLEGDGFSNMAIDVVRERLEEQTLKKTKN
uniref:Uncharacterized protein n=1 Tax=Glossina pallidipes TaxID=7398 RepID=A0A1B0AGC7_GLOPL